MQKYEFRYRKSDAYPFPGCILGEEGDDFEKALSDAPVAIKRLEIALEWLNLYRDALEEQEVSINLTEVLGFDPWRILQNEQKRVERAQQVCWKVKNGGYKHPQQALVMTYRALLDQQSRVKEIVEQIHIAHEHVEDFATECGGYSLFDIETARDWADICWAKKHPNC